MCVNNSLKQNKENLNTVETNKLKLITFFSTTSLETCLVKSHKRTRSLTINKFKTIVPQRI